MRVLLLSEADVRKVLHMGDAVAIVEKAFAEFASGSVNMPQRPVIAVPEHDGAAYFMPCYLPEMGALAIKVVDGFKGNPAKGLPFIHGVIVLINNETGAISSVMEGGYITAVRTGAASGVATKHLSREDSQVAAILGAGVQGVTQLEAICEVRDIKSVWIYDTNDEIASRYVREMKDRGGRIPADIRIASSPGEAVQKADIVCTATTSKVPIFDGGDLQPGVHVNGIGSHSPGVRELDTTTIVRSKVVCDYVSACLSEAGDLQIPIEEGRFKPEDIHGDLGDVIVGKLPGRESGEEITLFKSVGLAFQDASTALHIYKEAKKKGIGSEIEL